MDEIIVTKINDTLSRGFEIPMDKLKPEAHLFKDLGLDSLDAVDMLVLLEEEMKVQVNGELFMSVRTLQDVYDTVEKIYKESSVTVTDN